jgi:hypothetical protein
MPSVDQIAEKQGLHNVPAAIKAATEVGLPLAAAFAVLQKESGGRNIWGNDRGGVFAGSGNREVTEATYREFRRRIDAGERSNGCGPTQITWPGYFPLAERQGLKLWIPLDNMRFGFRILLDHYNANGKSWEIAGTRYNGASAYGRSFAALVRDWTKRLAGAAGQSETRPPEEKPMARKTFRGKTFDARTAAMLAEVARRTKAYVQPTQGSYSSSVGASAGTHSGGGAVDLHCASLPEDQALEIVRVMRQVGFAAWMRKPAEGNWPEHIHGIAIGCPDLSASAKRQVTAYKAGLSGLASGKKDRHASMGVKATTWEACLAKITGGAPPKVQVSLARVIAAAKADPKAPQGVGKHPADVRPVEAALRAEGLLADRLATDGAFGTATVEAYGAWQKSKAGGSFVGKAADGIPGQESLQRLGRKYGFEVSK